MKYMALYETNKNKCYAAVYTMYCITSTVMVLFTNAAVNQLSMATRTLSMQIRLRPIPEFTDTTDTDTLDLHRYRVPIPIPVVTSQPPGRVVSRYYARAMSRPVLCMHV